MFKKFLSMKLISLCIRIVLFFEPQWVFENSVKSYILPFLSKIEAKLNFVESLKTQFDFKKLFNSDEKGNKRSAI